MTQEEKQLLFKDLCARMPYGVRVKIYDEDILLYEHNENWTLDGKEIMSNNDNFVIKGKNDSWIISCEDFKPYLRPMSSMTEEEDKEWQYYKNAIVESCDEKLGYKIGALHNWLNSHHFDYRGLIPMGLALKAPEDMYK